MIDPHHRCADCRQTADRDQYGFASSQRDRLVELCAIGGQVTQAMLSYGWFGNYIRDVPPNREYGNWDRPTLQLRTIPPATL